MDKVNDEFFDKIYAACNQDCKILWSAFTIIAKDLNEFICNHAITCKGVDCFQSVYKNTISEDRFYLKKCSPEIFECLKDLELDCNITSQAKACEFMLEELTEKATNEQAWMAYPGWALIKGFKKKLMSRLCEADLPFQGYEEGTIDKKELTQAITLYLLDNEFTQGTLWYPFLIYLAILIVKTGNPPYCGDGDEFCC